MGAIEVISRVYCVLGPAKVKWNKFYKLFKALTSSDIA